VTRQPQSDDLRCVRSLFPAERARRAVVVVITASICSLPIGALAQSAGQTIDTPPQVTAPFAPSPAPLAPVPAGTAPATPGIASSGTPSTVAVPTTIPAARVVADSLAEAAVAALVALRGRPAAVASAASPQLAGGAKFDITGGVPTLPPPGAPPATDSVSIAAAQDEYSLARARVAQLVASRVKGVAAADLDAVWSRTDARRMTAVFAAISQVGTLYRYTGNEPGGFDCSGLTSWSWAQAGVKLPRISTDQINAVPGRPIDQVQPGDLVWRPGHIMMSLGFRDIAVDSPQSGKRVTVRPWGKITRAGSPVN
jgi:peptidoglycan DL-endopeptidase CwlO